MDLNKWLSTFMTYLRRFYCNDDMAFMYNEILKELVLPAAMFTYCTRTTIKNILLETLKNIFQILGLMSLARTGQELRFMFMMVFCSLQESRCSGELVQLITATSHVSMIASYMIQCLMQFWIPNVCKLETL